LDICYYGFTEMFNNVVEHSDGSEVSIQLLVNAARAKMFVDDNGVGIFEKIKNGLGLNDYRQAILELSKGKVTTDPEHHTGEGIFFTSRMFDRFSLLSGQLCFLHKEPGDDWLIEDRKEDCKGTFVAMEISIQSTRSMNEVFEKYAGELEDYGFTRTHVPLSLFRYGQESLVSRSQAKRLLARFDKFREVLLDFEGIETIGQAFADEIFRVFQKQNPDIKIVAIRANDEVRKKIRQVTRGALQE